MRVCRVCLCKCSERDTLIALEQAAQAAGLGVFAKVNPLDQVRKVDWAPDVRALYAKYKGHAISAVIDQVRDGSTLRCELILDPNTLTHALLTLHLAGVQCNRMPMPLSVLQQQYEKAMEANPEAKIAPPKAETPDPLALEAQRFTEDRLLHRDVKILLQGADKFNNGFGSVVFEKGNITERLLSEGLGQFVEWSAQLTDGATKLAA